MQNLPKITIGPETARNLLILAHGAGAPMDTDFMNYFAHELMSVDLRILRFEFPYMALRRVGHGKRPPNPQKVLLQCWRQIISEERGSYKGNIFIGGKSMGGRMASMVADECNVAGLVLLGYPFYAPGKMDKPRIDHLRNLKTPSIVLKGERDPMGPKQIVNQYELSDAIQIEWMDDGNHDLKPRVRSGVLYSENLSKSVSLVLEFISKNS